MILSVDQRDVDRLVNKRARCPKAAKAAANDHNFLSFAHIDRLKS